MPATYLQEPTITQVLLSLTPTWSFSLQERCLVTGEFGYCTEFNTTSLEEIKPVWCSWDWSGILERHEEGYSTANFTLLQLLSFPNTTVCLTRALLMAKLSALKHLCKELWKQIHLSLLFFFILFRDVLTVMLAFLMRCFLKKSLLAMSSPWKGIISVTRKSWFL